MFVFVPLTFSLENRVRAVKLSENSSLAQTIKEQGSRCQGLWGCLRPFLITKTFEPFNISLIGTENERQESRCILNNHNLIFATYWSQSHSPFSKTEACNVDTFWKTVEVTWCGAGSAIQSYSRLLPDLEANRISLKVAIYPKALLQARFSVFYLMWCYLIVRMHYTITINSIKLKLYCK